ncbi:hypothetical protein, partial [Halalkalibacter lacteus]|uniref:hypothetical protein n=1 Tax=Halalkalibacter lacteus TaxID=3090663 RepID=UPI002FC9BF5D
MQPVLELTSGAPVGPGPRPALVEATSAAESEEAADLGAPDFEAVSPVLIGRREAWGLAHFIYMAIEAREIRESRPADYRRVPNKV